MQSTLKMCVYVLFFFSFLSITNPAALNPWQHLTHFHFGLLNKTKQTEKLDFSALRWPIKIDFFSANRILIGNFSMEFTRSFCLMKMKMFTVLVKWITTVTDTERQERKSSVVMFVKEKKTHTLFPTYTQFFIHINVVLSSIQSIFRWFVVYGYQHTNTYTHS